MKAKLIIVVFSGQGGNRQDNAGTSRGHMNGRENIIINGDGGGNEQNVGWRDKEGELMDTAWRRENVKHAVSVDG